MVEPFRTTEVDLAAYLKTLGHQCTGVSYDENARMGEFEFMPSPGLEKQVNKWRNGDPDASRFRMYARERVSLYRWAKSVCDANR